MPFRRATLTYSDGDNSVKVSGITADKVTLKFGDDGSDQYAALVNAGAFSDATSGHIYEEPGKGILASLRQNSACQYLLMNCDYSIPTLLLRFLGACVYGDVRAPVQLCPASQSCSREPCEPRWCGRHGVAGAGGGFES